VVNSTPWPHFTPGKDPVPILHEAGWAPGSVWTGGKFRPQRDSIPDRPARSQSLYQLSYTAHCKESRKVNLLYATLDGMWIRAAVLLFLKLSIDWGHIGGILSVSGPRCFTSRK